MIKMKKDMMMKTMHMSREQNEKLKLIAKEQQRSHSAVIRKWIEDYELSSIGSPQVDIPSIDIDTHTDRE